MARDSRHLLNPLAPLDTLTPSAQDGVPDLLERDLRACSFFPCISPDIISRTDFDGFVTVIKDGAMLIQQAGIMLEA